MSPRETLERLEEQGVIPVLRLDDAALALDAVTALREIGFRVFEITLTIPGAAGLISRLASDAELILGAGTVLSLDEARKCLDAGARFLVSPCLLDGLAEVCSSHGAVSVEGALTPSEVRQAALHGADAVKIFPISSMGGPRHLKALRTVFPHLPLVPTGGIGLDNFTQFFSAGAVCVGVGGELFDAGDLLAGRVERVAQQAGAFLDRLREHRNYLT